jgi:hypothetical protein
MIELSLSKRMQVLCVLPQTVRENMRLVIAMIRSRANQRTYHQSRICADLSSESPCLRGESFRSSILYS